uniref:Uncharacterized protein n=1 Tax=Anguilla anguilla TaxID=7936 RepID=A0A0E9WIM1_ANGAN
MFECYYFVFVKMETSHVCLDPKNCYSLRSSSQFLNTGQPVPSRRLRSPALYKRSLISHIKQRGSDLLWQSDRDLPFKNVEKH